MREALEATERQVGRRVLRMDATPCLKVSRCPYAVARERGGNFRSMVWVNKGIPWIYPRERARRKVEREGNRNFGGGRRQSERPAEKREKREQCEGLEG